MSRQSFAVGEALPDDQGALVPSRLFQAFASVIVFGGAAGLSLRPAAAQATDEVPCGTCWCATECEVEYALCGWEYCCWSRSCPATIGSCPWLMVRNCCSGFQGPC